MEEESCSSELTKTIKAYFEEFKAPRPDELQSRVLQELLKIIGEQVIVIYKRTGELMKSLKEAQVFSFIFQKMKKEDLGNYRPANLMSILHKVLE